MSGIIVYALLAILLTVMIVQAFPVDCSVAQKEGFENTSQITTSCPAGSKSFIDEDGNLMCCSGQVNGRKCEGQIICTFSQSASSNAIPICKPSPAPLQGRCKQGQYQFDNFCCSTPPSDYNFNTKKYTKCGGAMCALDEKNTNGKPLCYPPLPPYKDPKWKEIPGSLVTVDTDGKILAGINSSGALLVADTNILTAPNWFNIPAVLSLPYKIVCVSNGGIFWYNGEKFGYRKNYKDIKDLWILNGDFIDISLSGTMGACTSERGLIILKDLTNDSKLFDSSNFIVIPGTWKKISLDKGRMLAIGNDDYVYYTESIENPQWVKHPIQLKQVSLSGDIAAGVDMSNNVFTCDNLKNQKWEKINGVLKQIKVFEGNLYGCSPNNGTIYTAQQ